MPNPVDLTTLSSDLPVFLQNGIGVGYSAIDARRTVALALQEGVLAAGDGKVTQRAGGAGMAVDVAAFDALVKGDTVAGEGMYYVRRSAALTGATELTATAADGANPRIDQIILEIKNDVHDGSGLNRGRIRYLAGTATAGATLANRTGAAALPNSAIRLADVLMPAAAANVPTANIRDRRPWARGAFRRALRTAGSYTTSSTTFAQVDATNLNPRIECSGMPLRLALNGRLQANASGVAILVPTIDGAAVDGATGDVFTLQPSGDGSPYWSWVTIPTVGSHVIGWQWRNSAATLITLFGTAANPLLMLVEELVRQDAENT